MRQRPCDPALFAAITLTAKAAVCLAGRHGRSSPVCPAGTGRAYRQRRRARRQALQDDGLCYALGQLDALHHTEFEHAVQALLCRDGCRNAARSGGSGDLGADIAPVGTRDLQILNGIARPAHGADIAVLITNGRITTPRHRPPPPPAPPRTFSPTRHTPTLNSDKDEVPLPEFRSQTRAA